MPYPGRGAILPAATLRGTSDLITIHTIASGSEGNCLLVTAGSTHILVDAGISCRRIGFALGQLGLSPGSVAAVLITHEHGDHICGLQTMVRR